MAESEVSDLSDLVWGLVWQATSRALYGDLLDKEGAAGASSKAGAGVAAASVARR